MGSKLHLVCSQIFLFILSLKLGQVLIICDHLFLKANMFAYVPIQDSALHYLYGIRSFPPCTHRAYSREFCLTCSKVFPQCDSISLSFLTLEAHPQTTRDTFWDTH